MSFQLTVECCLAYTRVLHYYNEPGHTTVNLARGQNTITASLCLIGNQETCSVDQKHR